MNDPNGLVFHRGTYHVFFQYNPYGPRHANMHWGHATSEDLLSWRLQPIAIRPTPGGADRDGVWSGSALVEDDVLHAFYSAKRDDRWWQPVARASSRDGVVFDKTPELVVPDPPPGTVMFRDPYVWRDGCGWRMLVGAGFHDGRAAALHYRSADLEQWTYTGPLLSRLAEPLATGGTTERGWECVQYATFEHQAALIVSAWDPLEGARGTAVYLGTELDDRLDAAAPEAFDHGPDLYAPALLHAPDGRWLAWAWIWEARDEVRVGGVSDWTDQVGWAGMLSTPRELSVTEHGLHQEPARELARLRRNLLIDTDLVVAGASTAELGAISAAADLVARIARPEPRHEAAGLRLVTDADGREYLDLALDGDTGDLIVDRRAASLDERAKGGTWRVPTAVEPGEDLSLRVIIDHSVVELFTGNGKSLTLRFYPTSPSSWRLQARSSGGPVSIGVTAWSLNGILLEESDERGATPH